MSVKFKDGIGAELCLKLWFESNRYFCNMTEKQRHKVLNNHFLKSF